MAQLPIVGLDVSGSTLDVPQAGDTYIAETDLEVDGDLNVTGIILGEAIFSAHVETVADQEYVITYDAPFAGTITTARTKTESGTCTVTGEIDDTNLGGTANSASSVASEQAHASANTYAKGAKIAFTVSANSSAVDLEVTLYGYRTA